MLLFLFLVWVFRFPLFEGWIRDRIRGALEAEGILLETGGIRGSLITGAEILDLRVAAAPGRPEIRSASVRRVRASWSPVALLLGSDAWLETVEVEGLRAVLDLGVPAPPAREREPAAGGGSPPHPAAIRLRDLDLTVIRGGDRFALAGLAVAADRTEDGYTGTVSAASLEVRVEGDVHRAVRPRASFRYAGGALRVDEAREGDRELGRLLEADLSRLDEGRLAARIDLPLPGGRVRGRVSGDFSGPGPGVSAALEIEHVDPRPFLRFLGLPGFEVRTVAGTVEGSIPGDGEPSLEAVRAAFDLVLTGTGYAGRPSRSLTVRGDLAGGILRARGEVEGKSTGFSARLALAAERFLDGRFTLRSVDASRARLAPAGLPVAGRVSGEGTVSGPFGNPSFSVDLAVEGARWGPYSARRVELSARGTPEEITVPRLVVEDGGDRLRASGRIATAEPVRFRGEAEVHVADLSARRDLLPAELPPRVSGALDLAVRADGTPDAPGLSLVLTARDPRVRGFAAGEVRLEARVPDLHRLLLDALTARGVPGVPPLTLTAEISRDARALTVREGRLLGPGGEVRLSGRVPLVPGEDLHLSAALSDVRAPDLARALSLPFPVLGLVRGDLRAEGTLERPRVDLELDIEAPGVAPPGRPAIRADRLSLSARLAEGRARLRTLRITAPGYTVEARARAPLDLRAPGQIARAPLSGELRVRGLPLSAAGPIPGVPRADGTLDLTLDLSGEVGSPRARGDLVLRGREIRAEGVPGVLLADLELRLGLTGLGPAGGSVRVESLSASALGVPVRGEGSFVLERGNFRQPRFTLSVPGADLASLAARLGLELPAAGTARARLRVLDGPRLALEVTGRDLRAGDVDLGTLDLAADWEDGVFSVRRGRVGGGGRYLSLTGTVPLALSFAPPSARVSGADSLDLHVVAHGLDLAEAGLPDSTLRAAGAVRADLYVTGPVTDPSWRGEIRLDGGRLRAPGAPPVEDLQIALTLRPGRILVRELTGTAGRGTFQVHGDVTLERGRPARVNLRLGARNLLLVRKEGLRLRSDLDLTLTGRAPDDLLLAGDATLRTFRALGHTGLLRNYFENRGALSSRPTVAPLPVTADPVLGAVRLDVRVKAPPESIRVRDEFVDAVAEGALRVTGTVAVPRPDGRIHVARGKATLPTATMDIEHAVVEFRRHEPLRPYVTARATTRIPPWRVTADLSGAADAPRIRLSSDPALPEPDVVSLLTTGAVRSEAAGALGGVAARFLGRQILSELSSGGSDSPFSRLADRIEVEIDSSKEGTGGIPAFRATLRLIDHWLYLRGAQDDPRNYGLDLVFRFTFR